MGFAVYGRFVPIQVRTRTFRPEMFRPITSSSHCKFVPWTKKKKNVSIFKQSIPAIYIYMVIAE